MRPLLLIFPLFAAAALAAPPSDDQCLNLLYGGVLKIVSGVVTVAKMEFEGPPPASFPCGVVTLVLNAAVEDYNAAGCSRGYSGGNAVFEARVLALLRKFVQNPEDCPVLDNGVPSSEYERPPEVTCDQEEEMWSVISGAVDCAGDLEATVVKMGGFTEEAVCPLFGQFSNCMEPVLEQCYVEPQGQAAASLKQQAVAGAAGMLRLLEGDDTDWVDLVMGCPKDIGLVVELDKLNLYSPLEPVDESVIREAMDTPLLVPDMEYAAEFAARLEDIVEGNN